MGEGEASNKEEERYGSYFKEALAHSREHFIYHARQRLEVLKYFLVYLIAITTGFFALVRVNPEGLPSKGVIALMALFITWVFTFLFFLLEERNRKLVAISEKPLRELENRLSLEVKVNSLSMIDASDIVGGFTYKFVVRLFFAMSLIVHTLTILYFVDLKDILVVFVQCFEGLLNSSS